jgi:hypothetical protein
MVAPWNSCSRRSHQTQFAVKANRRDKPIPPFGNGLNELGIVGFVAKGLSNLKDVFPENLRVYIGVRPDSLQHFIRLYQPSRILDEVAQDVIRFWSDRNPLGIPPKAMIGRIQPEGTKRLHFRQHTYLTDRQSSKWSVFSGIGAIGCGRKGVILR